MERIFKKLKVDKIESPKLVMCPLELKDYIDFEVKRVYFFSDISEKTGAHCHMEEKELFVMVQGKCVAVIDHGNGLEDVPLEGPTDAIYVGNHVWHHFKDCSPDAIILALSSTNYNPDRSDYIQDYGEYLEIMAR